MKKMFIIMTLTLISNVAFCQSFVPVAIGLLTSVTTSTVGDDFTDNYIDNGITGMTTDPFVAGIVSTFTGDSAARRSFDIELNVKIRRDAEEFIVTESYLKSALLDLAVQSVKKNVSPEEEKNIVLDIVKRKYEFTLKK